MNCLNLGCGRVILPAPRPAHYTLLPQNLVEENDWMNVDREDLPGVDKVIDLFRYPWDLPDDTFDAVLMAHLAEHIPHVPLAHPLGGSLERSLWGARRAGELLKLQDGWYAFFSEVYRVLKPGGLVWILSPYAWSDGAVTDPSHTRMLTPGSFLHSMAPDPNAPFKYNTGGLHFVPDGEAEFGIHPAFASLVETNVQALQQALMFQVNVASEFMVRLKAVK